MSTQDRLNQLFIAMISVFGIETWWVKQPEEGSVAALFDELNAIPGKSNKLAYEELFEKLQTIQPELTILTEDEALEKAREAGFVVSLSPSFVEVTGTIWDGYFQLKKGDGFVSLAVGTKDDPDHWIKVSYWKINDCPSLGCQVYFHPRVIHTTILDCTRLRLKDIDNYLGSNAIFTLCATWRYRD